MNVNEYQDLPFFIKEKLKKANIYYDAKYIVYEKQNNNSVWYLYNDFFIQVVSVNSIKKIFFSARLVSEPFALSAFFKRSFYNSQKQTKG